MEDKPITPLRAIRGHCVICAGRPKDARECLSTKCILYQYRMGHNPARKGIGPGRSISNGILPNSTQVSEGFAGRIKARKRMYKAKTVLIKPNAIVGEIDIVQEGQIAISNHNGKLMIEISTAKEGETHVANAQGKEASP